MANPTAYHIAHLNIAILRYGWEDVRSAEFINNLERVTELAHRSPGFVWQAPEVEGGGGGLADSEIFLDNHDNLAITLSVWETARELDHFVHNTVHGAFLKRQSEWFDALDFPTYVIWPIVAGHVPTMFEAKEKLDHLTANGSSDAAYQFDFLLVAAE